MPISVAQKIIVGFLIILGLGTITLIVTYQGLRRVERQLHQLAEVHEPASSAAHEMEINVNGIAIGTLGYVGTPDPRFKELGQAYPVGGEPTERSAAGRGAVLRGDVVDVDPGRRPVSGARGGGRARASATLSPTSAVCRPIRP